MLYVYLQKDYIKDWEASHPLCGGCGYLITQSHWVNMDSF